MSTTRYPLSWPAGWKRTPARERQRAEFARVVKAWDVTIGKAVRKGERPLTVYDAILRLTAELHRLDAEEEILSTNVQVRLDGLPRSNQPADPGAAVYFILKHKPLALACDRWTRVADNVAAIAQHIDALRRIDRYGVGSLTRPSPATPRCPPPAARPTGASSSASRRRTATSSSASTTSRRASRSSWPASPSRRGWRRRDDEPPQSDARRRAQGAELTVNRTHSNGVNC